MLNNVAQSNPSRFPRWITLADGNTLTVPDHQTMSAFLGQEYDENAELVVKLVLPPTLDEVLKAGYPPLTAASIVARETAKHEQGIEPYGAKPVAEFVEPIETPQTGPVVITVDTTAAEPITIPAADGTISISPEVAEIPAYPTEVPAVATLAPEDDLAGMFTQPEPETVPAAPKARRKAKE